jgi:hypothetical protein
MTLGQYRVEIDFNPEKNEAVAQLKGAAANWIDFLENYSHRDDTSPEARRLIAHAQTVVEDAAIWSVKAVTKKPRT